MAALVSVALGLIHMASLRGFKESVMEPMWIGIIVTNMTANI